MTGRSGWSARRRGHRLRSARRSRDRRRRPGRRRARTRSRRRRTPARAGRPAGRRTRSPSTARGPRAPAGSWARARWCTSAARCRRGRSPRAPGPGAAGPPGPRSARGLGRDRRWPRGATAGRSVIVRLCRPGVLEVLRVRRVVVSRPRRTGPGPGPGSVPGMAQARLAPVGDPVVPVQRGHRDQPRVVRRRREQVPHAQVTGQHPFPPGHPVRGEDRLRPGHQEALADGHVSWPGTPGPR